MKITRTKHNFLLSIFLMLVCGISTIVFFLLYENTIREYPVIHVMIYHSEESMEDLPKVQDALNAHLKRKIGVEVSLIPVSLNEYRQKADEYLSNNEKVDLVFVTKPQIIDNLNKKGELSSQVQRL